MWLTFTEAPAWPAWLGRPDDEAGPQALASQGELARLGPAYGGPAWPGFWPEAGPCPPLHWTRGGDTGAQISPMVSNRQERL